MDLTDAALLEQQHYMNSMGENMMFPSAENGNISEDEDYEFVPSPCLWVGSIPSTVSESELKAMFEVYGEIVNIRHFKLSKCAFVTFKKTAYAQASLELEGKEIGDSGSKLTLNIGKASRHLWIGNINDSVTEAKLKNAFEEFGVIESVRILRKNSCGFVNFVSAMDAVRAAEALNDKEIEGQRIVVNFQWNENIRRTAKKNLDIKAKEKMQNEVRRKFQEPSRQLFIGNLVPSVTESTLWTLFQKFGQVESIRAFINRGYAFVTYVDLANSVWVRNQLSLYPPTLGNRKLVVNFGKQPPEPFQQRRHNMLGMVDPQTHGSPYNSFMPQNDMYMQHNNAHLMYNYAQNPYPQDTLSFSNDQGKNPNAPMFFPGMTPPAAAAHMQYNPYFQHAPQHMYPPNNASVNSNNMSEKLAEMAMSINVQPTATQGHAENQVYSTEELADLVQLVDLNKNQPR